MKSFADYEVGDTVAYRMLRGYVIAKLTRLTKCHAVLDNGHRFDRRSGFVIAHGDRVEDYSDPTVQQRVAECGLNPKYVRANP